jgi:ribose-phosphate pyrophosphokinase
MRDLSQELGRRQVGKARDFDSRIRRFESCRPSQTVRDVRWTGPAIDRSARAGRVACFFRQLVLSRVGKQAQAMNTDGILIFSGNANRPLAESICHELGIPLGKALVGQFSDGEVQVEIEENVRRQEVFVIQSTSAPTADHFMELLAIVDALKRASAASVTAVMPYFGYARQDRRQRSARVPITAKVAAKMIDAVGTDRLLTVDLHADQIQGFFEMPVDNVYASPVLLADIWRQQGSDDLIVVSPDVGGVVRARAIAKRLDDADLAIIDKRRPRPNESTVMNIIGDVQDKLCVLVDDIVDTAGTLCAAARALKERGARRVIAYCTHPVLSGAAIDNLEGSVLDELVVTDTILLGERAAQCKRIRQLSVAELLAETIRRIAFGQSVSSLYVD